MYSASFLNGRLLERCKHAGIDRQTIFPRPATPCRGLILKFQRRPRKLRRAERPTHFVGPSVRRILNSFTGGKILGARGQPS